MPSIADYVGIPYVLHGRDRQGADCYGLVCLVYKEMLGIVLPEYTYQDRQDGGALIDAQRQLWRELENPEPYCVAVVRSDPMHCAVVIDADRMVHTYSGASSVVVRYRTPHWKPRILGFYAYDPDRSKA